MTDDDLERQVLRASFYTHTALSEAAEHQHQVEVLLLGLIDVLMARLGAVTEGEVEKAAAAVDKALVERGEMTGPGLMLRVDEPAAPPAQVDCEARFPICRAICCKLQFALSAEEVEAGEVRWDMGRPYAIRHTPEGFCVHNDRSTGRCGAYPHRPGICRTYSCATDERIWKDFEGRVLNQEWLDANLVEPEVRLAGTAMVPVTLNPTRRPPGEGPSPQTGAHP